MGQIREQLKKTALIKHHRKNITGKNIAAWRVHRMKVMKGYYVGSGYMGMVDGEYMMFSDEEDYREYLDAEE